MWNGKNTLKNTKSVKRERKCEYSDIELIIKNFPQMVHS